MSRQICAQLSRSHRERVTNGFSFGGCSETQGRGIPESATQQPLIIEIVCQLERDLTPHTLASFWLSPLSGSSEGIESTFLSFARPRRGTSPVRATMLENL